MTNAGGSGLRLPTRRNTYGLLVGVGAAMLVIGLTIPFVVADPVTDGALTSDGPATAPLGSDDELVGTDASTTTTVAAGTTPTGPGATGGAAGTPGTTGNEPRRASDRGITADAITVGIPVPDTSATGDTEGGVQFGEAVGDFRKQYQAAIDAVNEAGGINGRRVRPVYRTYAVGDADAMRAACIHLTEEQQVFAILGGFFGEPILCITEQHDTPLVAQASEPDDYYARSNGNYFSISATKDKQLRDLVTSAERDGLVTGRKVGILSQEGVDAIPVDRTLLPALRARGVAVAYHARIANDVGAAQSQIPIEVQRMRSAGVDTVIMASGLIRATVFVQEATNQRWRPQYLLSDFAGGATDVYTIAMPDSFEGAAAYTSFRTGEARTGQPEAAHDRACRENYERRTGTKVDRTTIVYTNVVTACGITELFRRGLAAAGPNPDRRSFSRALQGIGRFEVPFGSTGSFAVGKFDAPDTIRRVTWKADCTCWLPVDGFRPTS